jgi:hypothetical protein
MRRVITADTAARKSNATAAITVVTKDSCPIQASPGTCGELTRIASDPTFAESELPQGRVSATIRSM